MSISLLVVEFSFSIFVYKGLTGNYKYPRLGFAQYLETGVSWDTKFGTNVSINKLMNAVKCQGYL